jgi:hypothetical protein
MREDCIPERKVVEQEREERDRYENALPIEFKTHPWGASHNDPAALPFRVSSSPSIAWSASVAFIEVDPGALDRNHDPS